MFGHPLISRMRGSVFSYCGPFGEKLVGWSGGQLHQTREDDAKT